MKGGNLDYNQLTSGLDQRQISPYQIYNLDVDYPQFFSVDHYTKNPKDDIDINQRIQKVFLDNITLQKLKEQERHLSASNKNP